MLIDVRSHAQLILFRVQSFFTIEEPALETYSSRLVDADPTGASGGQWDVASRLMRLVVMSEGFRRRRDDPDGDDEREHRSVDRRMNEEKPADCCADSKRNKHTAHAAPLIAC